MKTGTLAIAALMATSLLKNALAVNLSATENDDPIVWREFPGFCRDANNRLYDKWVYENAEESECKARCAEDVNCVGIVVKHDSNVPKC